MTQPSNRMALGGSRCLGYHRGLRLTCLRPPAVPYTRVEAGAVAAGAVACWAASTSDSAPSVGSAPAEGSEAACPCVAIRATSSPKEPNTHSWIWRRADAGEPKPLRARAKRLKARKNRSAALLVRGSRRLPIAGSTCGSAAPTYAANAVTRHPRACV